MFLRMFLCCTAIAAISGCSLAGLGFDPKQVVDEMVEDDMLGLNQDKKIPAVEFFEKGGKHYEVMGRGEGSNVDRNLVLPLMKRLRDEFKAEPIVLVPDDAEYCWEIVVKLPAGAAARAGIAKAISETDAKFAGEIAADWGHKWLAFNFQDPDEIDE
jgi:hypothetical protein